MAKPKLVVEYVPKGDLKTYAKNAKVHTADQIESIKKSIEQFGFNDPIAVWKGNEIIEGHGRLLAAMEMEDIKEVPIIRLDSLTDKQRKAYIIAHNKLTLNTNFDNDILGEELKELLPDFDMTDFGFGDFELSMLTEDFTPAEYDEEEIAEYTQAGEVGLAKKRIIITYDDDTESILLGMLGIEEVKKIVYDIKELV